MFCSMLLLTTGRVFTIQLSTAQAHVSILNTLHPIMQTRNGGRGSSPGAYSKTETK